MVMFPLEVNVKPSYSTGGKPLNLLTNNREIRACKLRHPTFDLLRVHTPKIYLIPMIIHSLTLFMVLF